jgi:pSer/pThr/pTyr-binding forkhead associated (FHA) protein
VSRLVIYEGEEQRAEHELARAVIGLGRHPQNDIVLDDRTLSRFHARIERRDAGFVVLDLGAQNGVHVNGERIEQEAPLSPGDRIELGRFTAVFQDRPRARVPQAPLPPPPATIPTPVSAVRGVGAAARGFDDDLDLDIEMNDDLDGDLVGEFDDPPTNKGDDFADASQVEYRPPQPTLVLLFNGSEVSRHEVTDNGLVIGRSKQCDVVISLLGLSRRHSRIVVTDDGIAVEDLGSQNGTWVNNERIEQVRVLRHGDLLNFYDYGVLFLEDGDVDVGFPAAGPPASAPAVAEKAAPARGAAPRPRPSTVRSPLADFGEVPDDETAMGRGRPQHGGLNLDDLGDGSFLGDEFEDGASKARDRNDAPAATASSSSKKRSPPAPMGTELIDSVQLSRGAADEDLEAEVAFSSAASPDDFIDAGTNGDRPGMSDRTTTGFDVAAALGGAWPTDDDLERALMVTADSGQMSLEVTLRGKPYTQIPLTQPVMRVGSDPRCEVAMPKTAGLRPWHFTLSQVGSAVLCVRSNRAAIVEINNREIDGIVLHSGDVIKAGKVELKLRVR